MDRLAHEGKEARPEDSGDSKYADAGTVIHHLTQHMLGATFPPDRDVPPTDAQVENASRLWGTHCNEDTMRHATSIADVAASCMRQIGPRKWLAESEYKMPGYLSGHIDFLSEDGEIIADLKTTSRKPDHMRIKAGHLIQLIAYWILSGRKAKYGYVLYVDSERGAWAILCPFDFRSDAVQRFIEHVENHIAFITGPDLLRHARPTPGLHCAGDFCPYRAQCRDVIIPPPGTLVHEAGKMSAPRAQMSL